MMDIPLFWRGMSILMKGLLLIIRNLSFQAMAIPVKKVEIAI